MKKSLPEIAKAIGAVLLPDNDQYINRMKIRSESSDREYIIAQRKANQQWSCGCKGWIIHRHCKHLDNIMPQLENLSDIKKLK